MTLPALLGDCAPARPGECYEIVVGGFGSEGDYNLSISCTIVNTTPVPVGCGSMVTGSTVGLPSLRGYSSGDKQHIFCPNTTATAEVSTCGSSFDTELYINGSNVDDYFDDSGTGSCAGQETGKFNFEAGECYDIIVGGVHRGEGTFSLSIDCFNFIDVTCGSKVSNSTVGSRGGIKNHLFCPTQTGRVEASTCGSSFETEIQTNGTVRDSNCADCLADSNAACVGFNFRCGGKGSRFLSKESFEQ